MQRQRGELVPIGEVVADLPGPVQAIREASPQALHHFTQADQVHQLVGASEADPDLGFMARMMALPAGDLARDLAAHHSAGRAYLRTALQGRHRLGGNFYFVVAAQPWIETQ